MVGQSNGTYARVEISYEYQLSNLMVTNRLNYTSFQKWHWIVNSRLELFGAMPNETKRP